MGNETKYLTTEQMEEQVPGEWVLLDGHTTDRLGTIAGGRVLVHDADRAAFEAEAERYPSGGKAIVHAFDPHAEPIEVMSPFFIEDEVEWTSDSTPGGPTSTSAPLRAGPVATLTH